MRNDREQQGAKLSDNSRRIARNTLLLYFRMLLMMAIGLFTSRIVLDKLGESDYGVWNAVGGVVTAFTFLTAAISNAISRFLAFEIGVGDKKRLERVFATSVLVQLGLCVVLVVLVETLGMWLLVSKMSVPPESLGSAKLVLHCSLGVLVVNMLAVPFNAAIVAHERMGAFAGISIVEAVLKLGVAGVLAWLGSEKLKLYAFLMLGVALLVRGCYGLYCRKNFAESRAKLCWDKEMLSQMLGFASWSFIGSGAVVLNTQGITVLVNMFFGVVVSAARGVAAQVENIVKQFATNFLTALNPQITKSWAAGNREYCFELVGKGAKFTFLILLAFVVPLLLEAELLLDLWLKEVPELAADFSRLTLIALLVDMTGNSLLTLQLATGRLRRYYLITGLCSLLCLPVVWLAFRLGGSVMLAYWVLIGVYALVFALKMLIVSRETGFPVGKFVIKTLLPCAGVGVLSLALGAVPFNALEDGLLRLVLVCGGAWLGLIVGAWCFALTSGEKMWALGKLRPWMSDRAFLRYEYFRLMGRRLSLKQPRAYTEKVQCQKLRDRNPLYHKLVDKAEVKDYVAGKISSEHVVRTLGLWSRACEIEWSRLPQKFVLKCTHDSGSVWVCEGLGGAGDVAMAARAGAGHGLDAGKDSSKTGDSGLRADGAVASRVGGFSAVADDVASRRAEIEAQVEKALGRSHYRTMREWAYKGVQPRVIAEEYIGSDLRDYKFFCFNGVPKLLYVASERGVMGSDFASAQGPASEEGLGSNIDSGAGALGLAGRPSTDSEAGDVDSRGSASDAGVIDKVASNEDRLGEVKFDFFDMDFRHLDIRNGHPNAAVTPQKPQCFEQMKQLAATLSQGMSQVRVDFYEAGGRVLFGEYTFYHFGGFMPFEPDEADYWIGSLWEE